MIRALVACAATACIYTGAHAQPTAACQTDHQCEVDFYCDRDFAYICRRCLNCEQLKREPPRVPSHCIKSVADCGSCIPGLVEDLRGDVNLECVPPESRSDDVTIPAYVWVIISIGLVLFVLVVVIVIYVLRNTNTFKIRLASHTSVQSACGEGSGAAVVASAPELPPPYHAHYSAVRPSSPLSPEPMHQDEPQHAEESSCPFIKRAPAGERFTGNGRSARESADSQAANVFNNPHYVRGPQLPPSYDAAGVVGLAEGAGGAADGASSDDEGDNFAHEDVTVASTWTPAADSGNVSSGAVSELSSQLEAARNFTLIREPHSHPPCGWQDSNNNRNASESLGAESGTGAGSSGAPAFIINVVQTINTMQPPPHRHEPGF